MHVYTVVPKLPEKLLPLKALAGNLYFSWQHEIEEFFAQMDKYRRNGLCQSGKKKAAGSSLNPQPKKRPWVDALRPPHGRVDRFVRCVYDDGSWVDFLKRKPPKKPKK